MLVQLRNALFGICAASSIIACSGSGSGSSLPSSGKIDVQPSPTPPPSAAFTLNGNIVKGTVRNAQIDFYRILEGEVDSAPLASVYSDAAGEFSVQLDSVARDDLILIRARGQAGAQTEMFCDAAQCGSTQIIDGEDSNGDGLITLGENVYLSEDFELSTVISLPANGDSLSTSITPLTHIAVAQASKQGALTREGVENYMQLLANLMSLPTTLTQLTAIDSARLTALIANGDAELESGALIYSVYSAMFAEYANQNQLTIGAAIQEVGDKLFSDSLEVVFDRNMVLIILQNALEVARLYAGNDESLQSLISEIRLLLVAYYCDEYASDDDCSIVVPEVPDIPDANELQVVKNFVADLRKWTRDVTLQAEPAVNNFTDRIALVEGLWEDDLKLLSASLNDLLPGIAQLVSPYYCGNFSECPYPEYPSYNQSRITWRGLVFTLDYSTRVMTIVGQLDDLVEVDIDLLLPESYYWAQEQRIAVTAGRLSYRDADLVLMEGSEIVAGFPYSLSFSELMAQISRPYLSPSPSSMRFDANFLLQTEYERAVQGVVDFDSDATHLPVNFSGDWFISEDRAYSGDASLRSRGISHRQRSAFSATFATTGGDLVYYSALESEGSFDFLRVYVDGRRVRSDSGYLPQFRRNTIYIPPGEHTVTWEYSKDGSVDRYADAAWIDSIRFPPFADSDLPTEFETRTVLNGTLSVSAEKLDRPWVWATKGFLPGDISINATLSSDFDMQYGEDGPESSRDTIALRLSANVANAADFVPPQALDYGSLAVIGDYGISGDVFTLNLPQQRFEVEYMSSAYYQYREYRGRESEPVVVRNYAFDRDEVSGLADVAGRLIYSSAVGWSIVVPEEGLYLSTLLGSSPWAPPPYAESRFAADGGSVFGYLVDAYVPSETAAQYLRLSAAVEIEAGLDGLQNTLLGTALTRNSLDEGDFGFYIEYDGQRFNFESDAWYTPDTYGQESELKLTSPSLTITNQQGVTLSVTLDKVIDVDGGEDEDEEQNKDVLTGEIIYKGSVYATIERVKGLTVIRYVDGSGESLE